MSEQEKKLQIGELAEEYSHLKGQLNHVTEKLSKALAACKLFAALPSPDGLVLFGEQITLQNPHLIGNQRGSFEHLLSASELISTLRDRDRLQQEVRACAERLRALAPHLL